MNERNRMIYSNKLRNCVIYIKNKGYIKTKPRPGHKIKLTNNIQEARVYSGIGAAQNSIYSVLDNLGIDSSWDNYEIIPVIITTIKQ